VEAGSIVAHAIFAASDEIMAGNVAMMALVKSLSTEKVGGGTSRCSRAFTLPEEGGSIIRFRKDSTFPNIKTLGSSLMVKEAAGKFQVTIGD